jgi:16S rRNA (adenine1518-N6/adenine1519-N6)-dimethyltransferase
MNLASSVVIKNLLEKYDVKPFKGLGQNFLVNGSILNKIVGVANLDPQDVVLEIGPGVGTLTQELARRVKKVIAVEKDKKMVQILKKAIEEFKNIEVIQEDILKIKDLRLKNYKVVANLPYNIASPVIRKFLESKNPPKEMVLMVQKEVAQRICAKPPDMNLLATSVQFYSKPEILFYVSKNNFWPRPKVDGAIIRLSLIRTNKKMGQKLFFKIIRAGFSQPRKQLANNLSKGLALNPSNGLKLSKEKIKEWLLKNKIEPSRRAETLNLEDWLKVTKNFYKI